MDSPHGGEEVETNRSASRSETTTAAFSLDEGYVEAQNEQDITRNDFRHHTELFQQWVSGLNSSQKREIAMEILRTLRTSQIASIVDELQPMLHHNFMSILPDELVGHILTFLDARTLLTASLASHAWHDRISDPTLWKELYKQEGWGFDHKSIAKFEMEYAALVRAEFEKARREMRTTSGKGRPLGKKRATSDWLDSKQRRISAEVATWQEQHGVVEADTDADQEMTDAVSLAASPPRPNKRQSHDSGDEMDYTTNLNLGDRQGSSELDLAKKLLVEDGAHDLKLNWPHIYQQRHKLEDNWMKAKYTNFQLPHPKYPQEAHTECVYTIQFQGKWLVSGSRDKTLRVWDLETRRLRGGPLVGHQQSVLCLQFDPSEEEDVIISGSSDASVIVWKFSTGQRLQTIVSAHEESVLNLKFDHRYLVTCSKDKKIKIWNRHTLTPLDKDYPELTERTTARAPSYIVNTSLLSPSMIEARLASGQIKKLSPYTHLMTLEGHQAAVNAIQIHGNIVVSASGDRHIRVWNAKSGVCLRVVSGHQKGIACVQYDSKRIVSGSSDNTVRIYDPLTAAEVAVLLGHTNLVRTVQAGFGDAPGDEEEGLRQARKVDEEWHANLHLNNGQDDRHLLRRIRNNEYGSSRKVVGSKLPPGGGGSKWGRIVSGSYDESIIIWKKDAKGNWIVGQVLRQDSAVRASIDNDRISSQHSGPVVARPASAQRQDRARPSTAPTQGSVPQLTQIMQQAVNTSLHGLQASIHNVLGINGRMTNTFNVSRTGNNAQANGLGPTVQAAINQAGSQIVNAGTNAMAHATAVGSSSFNMNYSSTTSQTTRNGETTSSHHATAGTASRAPSQASNDQADYLQQRALLAQESDVPVPELPAIANESGHTVALGPTTQAARPPQVPNINPSLHPNPNQTQAPTQNHQNVANANAAAQAAQAAAAVSRVFKLQFDARRIVCCSQDSRIIGWDFANGDPDLEGVCQFFVGP